METPEPEAQSIDLPASLQRRVKEPAKMVQFRIPLSWWEELSSLAQEFDQDVSTFLREATQDWLQRARRVQRPNRTDQERTGARRDGSKQA